MNPYISIIIPAYNEEDKIKDTLENIKDINEINEILVIDAKITKAMLLGKDKNVLKLKLLTNNNITIDAMIFNDLENFESKIIEKYGNEELDNLYNKSNNNIPMDFTFYPSINEWNGNKSIQIVVNGIR